VESRARTQFLSAVVLVVVFAAGGLVGAAVAGPDTASATDPVTMPAEPTEDREDEGGRERNNQYMFERAGATEAQAQQIRSEIFPWYQEELDRLWEDSAVQALDEVRDSLRREYRSADRALENYYDPLREALRDSARVLIRAELDPQAQIAYDSILAARSTRGRDGNRRP